MEPSTPLIWNWHIDAICAHLQAVAEQRCKRLIINIPPGHSKPVWAESPVLLADGRRVPIRWVEPGDRVVTHRGNAGEVTAVHDQGDLPTLRITTDTGRGVVAAHDHPFLTPSGWTKAIDLRVGDTLGLTIPRPGVMGQSGRSMEECRLAGYFVGDGNCTIHANKAGGVTRFASITCFDPEQARDICLCAESMGFECNESTRKGKFNVKNGGRDWLQKSDVGLAGKGSHTKRVPPFVFKAGQEGIANFIGAYFACDGTLNKKGNVRTDLAISFASVNRPLLCDVQHLLNRLGIRSRVRTKNTKFNSFVQGPHTSYCLELTGQDETAKFAARIPIPGVKARRIVDWGTRRSAFDARIMTDKIISIEDAGQLPCRCLTVEGDASFLIDDIPVHNSLLACVFFPAWVWLERPGWRGLFASYAGDLAIRDSLRCRDLITSKWYRETFRPWWELKADQNAKGSFENTAKGSRLSLSVGGKGTGFRGDATIVDDPINAQDAQSEAERDAVIHWWDKAMSSRLNDPRTGQRVVIMQRLHEDDLSGHLLRQGGYDHLCLPSEFNPERASTTSIGWHDPRTEPGELLFPELCPPYVIEEAKRVLGPDGYSGQHDQDPIPAGGSTFQREWFKDAFVDEVPRGARMCRGWDKAATSTGKGARTAGVKGALVNRVFYIADVVKGRWGSAQREQIILDTAHRDGRSCMIRHEQEPGSGGKDSARATNLNLTGYDARAVPAAGKGDKEARARPLAAHASNGLVKIVRAPWNKEFLDELCAFPHAKLVDQVDAVALAFNSLALTLAPAAPAFGRRGGAPAGLRGHISSISGYNAPRIGGTRRR